MLFQINVLWNRLSPTRKVLFGIVGVNLGVLLAWKVRALGNLMVTYFTSSPFKGTELTPIAIVVMS